jgi:hypothetical protein
MHYILLSKAPKLHKQLLSQGTDPLFRVELPLVNPPSKAATEMEIEFILDTMRSDFALKKDFIVQADKDFLSLFLELMYELGIQEDREKELRDIEKSLVIPIMKLKYHYNRARPFQYADKFGISFPKFKTETGHTPSYPSGHTIQSQWIASYLSSLYPNHREMFMSLAHDISFSRVQAGVHFPSDCVFGSTIAKHFWAGGPSSMKLAKNQTQEIWDRFQQFGSPKKVTRLFLSSKKKKVKNKDGETVEIYEYSETEVRKRHAEKSEQVEKVRKNLNKLQKQLKKDLKDPEKQEVALAVSLIDQTYERVGNDASAKEGRFGVTGWKKEHVTFRGNKAVIKYTGKSGVTQEREITDANTVTLLKEKCNGKSKGDCVLADTSAGKVNAYLKNFDVTAKDIRGYHANNEMLQNLEKFRKSGPKLPSDKKEKEKLLKEEFNKALEETAKRVGHESATLKGQYLVPHLEDTYMKDGTVIKKLKASKTASQQRVVQAWLFEKKKVFPKEAPTPGWEWRIYEPNRILITSKKSPYTTITGNKKGSLWTLTIKAGNELTFKTPNLMKGIQILIKRGVEERIITSNLKQVQKDEWLQLWEVAEQQGISEYKAFKLLNKLKKQGKVWENNGLWMIVR